MENAISKFVEQLKKRLIENKANYVNHNSMLGNTKGGFYETDEIDFDNLLKEIDTFSDEFKNKTQPGIAPNE